MSYEILKEFYVTIQTLLGYFILIWEIRDAKERLTEGNSIHKEHRDNFMIFPGDKETRSPVRYWTPISLFVQGGQSRAEQSSPHI